MRELEYVKCCTKCSAVYNYDGQDTQCKCGEPLYNGFTNEKGELERDKFVGADIIYKNENGEEISWPFAMRFKEDQVDMFYAWDGYWNDFFEQEIEARKDDYKAFVKYENLVIDNLNAEVK